MNDRSFWNRDEPLTVSKLMQRTFGVEKASRSFSGIHFTLASFSPHFQVPKHQHDRFGLMTLIRGDLVGQAPWGAIERQPLSVAIDPRNRVGSPLIGPRGMTMLLVEFDDEALDRLGVSVGALGEGRVLHSPRTCSSVIRMMGALAADSPELGVSAAVELAGCFDGAELSSPLPGWLREAKDLVDETFHEDQSLTKVARHVGIDAMHLARRFRGRFGLSVGEYIQRQRLTEATKLILDRGKGVSDAALEMGFSDNPHFTRTFRQHYGLAPSLLRRWIEED